MFIFLPLSFVSPSLFVEEYRAFIVRYVVSDEKFRVCSCYSWWSSMQETPDTIITLHIVKFGKFIYPPLVFKLLPNSQIYYDHVYVILAINDRKSMDIYQEI